MRLFFTSILFINLICFNYVKAEEVPIKHGVVGIWHHFNEPTLKYTWNAQWIWLEDDKVDMMMARRNFTLVEIPKKATLKITASSKYELYINGKYILQGPARCAPHHQSFDVLEISKVLQIGKNSIAVRIHHQNKQVSYNFKSRAGLLADLEIDGNTTISTGNQWKVTPDKSWDNNAPKISRFHQAVGDLVDMQVFQKNWQKIDFDDSAWENPKVLKRTAGWPSTQKNEVPSELINPWTSLVPRDIPYLIEKEIKAINLIEGRTLDEEEKLNSIQLQGVIEKSIDRSFQAYTKKNNSLKIEPSTDKTFLLFDFGRIINSYPQLDIKGAKGLKVQVLAAPYMINNQFDYTQLESNLKDEITLSGTRDQWRAAYFKPARYLCIVLEASEEAIEFFDFSLLQISYPFKKKGSINANESWVSQYVDATAKTIDVCTTDAYTDNYRERRQYAQTGYYGALGNYWLFGDYALQRRYLIQVAQEQQANGIMPAYAPRSANDFMVIMDSNCLWVRSLRNYFLYSGDEKTVRYLLPSALKLMELLNSYTNELGLIDNPPYAYWLDHAKIDRRGANFTLNAHYLGALEDLAEVLEWLNNSQAKSFRGSANKVRSSLSKFWDNDTQLFTDALIDGKCSPMFSEHANGMALALKIASEEQAKVIAQQLLVDDNHDYASRESSLIMVTPALSYFLHKGLANYGMIEPSFDLMHSRFKKMLAPQYNGTLWEEWEVNGTGRSGKMVMGKTRSDAQTESAFMPALFAEYLLGIQPLKPGMKEIKVRWQNSSLKNLTATVPTPKGELIIKWSVSKSKNEGKLLLNIPAEITVQLDTESLNIFNNSLRVNDKIIISDGDSIPLSHGEYLVSF